MKDPPKEIAIDMEKFILPFSAFPSSYKINLIKLPWEEIYELHTRKYI